MVFPLFWIPFTCIYHASTFTPEKNRPNNNMVWNGINQLLTWVYKDSLTLRYPPSTNI